MKKTDVKEKIIQTIQEILEPGVICKKPKDSDTLRNGLGLDSLDMVELVMYLEKDLYITVPDLEENLGTWENYSLSEFTDFIYELYLNREPHEENEKYIPED